MLKFVNKVEIENPLFFRKKKSMFLHRRGWNEVYGAILAALHTNFLCLIRIQRSCGLIPGGNRKQVGNLYILDQPGMEYARNTRILVASPMRSDLVLQSSP